jgi:hypothetical protein
MSTHLRAMEKGRGAYLISVAIIGGSRYRPAAAATGARRDLQPRKRDAQGLRCG